MARTDLRNIFVKAIRDRSKPMPRHRAFQIIENVLGTDEPIFVLRAKDRLSTMALEAYLAIATDNDTSDRFQLSIISQIQTFRQWQQVHPDKMKTPDV